MARQPNLCSYIDPFHFGNFDNPGNVLKDQLHQPNGPRLFELRRELLSCTQGELSVSAYFSNIQSLSKELQESQPVSTCVCGGCQCKDNMLKDHIFSFLMGLNEGFSHIRDQILLMTPLPNINEVYAMVLQEAKPKEIDNSNLVSSSAPLVNVVHSGDANKNSDSKRDTPLCTHCGVPGHTIDKCFKLHGYPVGYKKGKQPDAST